jgi:hypothetical protein
MPFIGTRHEQGPMKWHSFEFMQQRAFNLASALNNMCQDDFSSTRTRPALVVYAPNSLDWISCDVFSLMYSWTLAAVHTRHDDIMTFMVLLLFVMARLFV